APNRPRVSRAPREHPPSRLRSADIRSYMALQVRRAGRPDLHFSRRAVNAGFP
ncbi:MAG: hypothetical protein BJ554DRAFT_6174, partial [Olpidium bornovanus]